ncbi:hypothetical protein [Tropicibacter sp. Alg240-R139]|nr:hypothetical protein [Tropicibacter sp. Alg240-R139]
MNPHLARPVSGQTYIIKTGSVCYDWAFEGVDQNPEISSNCLAF